MKTNRLSLRDGTPLLIQEVHTSYIDDEFELKTRLRVFLAWVMKFAEASLTPLSGVLQAKSCPYFYLGVEILDHYKSTTFRSFWCEGNKGMHLRVSYSPLPIVEAINGVFHEDAN